MEIEELIGRVGAEYLKVRIVADEDESTARYLLDCLSATQTAAIAKAVASDEVLAAHTEIKLPIHFVGGLGLPDKYLTSERTTYFRNAACDKPILLVANTGDDEEQSLKELEPIGRSQLLEKPSEWVRIAAKGLILNEDHRIWWEKALSGLLEVKHFVLERLAGYILATRAAIEKEGEPILSALGIALPELRIPRDSTYFIGLNERAARHRSRWKTLYAYALKRRACYLLKRAPNSQELIPEEKLHNSFESVKESIPESLHNDISNFIKAPGGWDQYSIAIAKNEWESIKPLFDGIKKVKSTLGDETKIFFEERDRELLSPDEWEYLERLRKRSTKEAQDEDEAFYQSHRLELKQEPALKAKWDRFVYGAPIETDDFLAGFAMCLETLFDHDFVNCKRHLEIRCDKKSKGDLKQLNNEAGMYFALRYKGLPSLFDRHISWDTGELFNYERLDKEWRKPKSQKVFVNRSVAKASLRLRFYLTLEVEFPNGREESYTKLLIWTFNPGAIPASLPGDLRRLAEHPLMQCIANLEIVSGKGHLQSIDLFDSKTLLPTYDRDRGSFVAVYKERYDIGLIWRENLNESRSKSFIDNDNFDKLKTIFDAFQSNYNEAINNFVTLGIDCRVFIEQAQKYRNLLDTVCIYAKGDRNRELLLRPLLEIGAVRIEGGKTTTIIAPWHPLRLAAIANKTHQITSLIKHLFNADEIMFGDTRLFFKELRDELKHPFYPEIVLGWNDRQPELLSMTDSYLDYSLHEEPVANINDFSDTSESPIESANIVLKTLRRFLELYPHEKANLSLVLYNSDSARLPRTIVEKVSDLQDGEDEMRCQISLRHRNSRKLNDLYIKIVEAADSNPDSFVASEASKDFMAQLRIGIMADQASVPNPIDGPPADLVFLQDVIARHAKIEWYPVDGTPEESSKHVPSRWSRRHPSSSDDMKSIVYLCSPVQTAEGWSYINAITCILGKERDDLKNKRLLPARQLDFKDTETSSIFKEVHNLGNWVVNYDELLDRRQLLNQEVRVIRYKQLTTQGRNVLISSTASLGLLQKMVKYRISNLEIKLTDDEFEKLANRFWKDASEVSGEIVLRAAKRGRNANELMGIVLSRFLIQHELGLDNHFGWYFLDDYAEWLGQREEQIADIMVLVPQFSEVGRMKLSVIVCESKYISSNSIAAKRRESQKQLRDTVRRIRDALFGDPRRLDRDLWLSRFSDLLLNGVQVPANSSIDLSKWRRAIRNGECDIFLRGYSHVFVHDQPDNNCSDFSEVTGLEDAYQEIFSRSLLRDLVILYQQEKDPTPLRMENADRDVWIEAKFCPPTGPSSYVEDIFCLDDNESVGENEIDNNGRIGVLQKNIIDDPKDSSEPTLLNKPRGTSPNNSKWTYPEVENIITHYHETITDSADDMEWLRKTENSCKGALQQFHLRAKLIDSVLTPNAALLRFQGSSNLTVEQVLRKRSEFLTTHMLNIISVKAEPGIVAISIARPSRRLLHVFDVWKGWEPDCRHGNYRLLVGLREEDSSPLFISPKDHMPHTLIAGSTGSGKSVLMQNIILCIACTNTVDQAKITLIDPKSGVDYFAFEDLPHLQNGVVDDQEQAVTILSNLVNEMERRYKILKANRVPDIYALNKKTDKSVHLPFLWIIHDEFAEWMMIPEYAENITNVITRLGVKARAAGIFLVFAAQRPDKDVMPMQLRSQLGNRLILRVDSEGTSEIALGEKGAERLLGKGHMAAKLEGENGIVTAQVPFISPEEIEEIVSKLN